MFLLGKHFHKMKRKNGMTKLWNLIKPKCLEKEKEKEKEKKQKNSNSSQSED